jgi:hypothetical protein
MPTATRTPKPITIVVAGSGKTRDVNVTPGLTVRDLLQQLNLTGYLSKVDDPSPLGENEDIYSRVHEGDKLILAPRTEVATRRSR